MTAGRWSFACPLPASDTRVLLLHAYLLLMGSPRPRLSCYCHADAVAKGDIDGAAKQIADASKNGAAGAEVIAAATALSATAGTTQAFSQVGAKLGLGETLCQEHT